MFIFFPLMTPSTFINFDSRFFIVLLMYRGLYLYIFKEYLFTQNIFIQGLFTLLTGDLFTLLTWDLFTLLTWDLLTFFTQNIYKIFTNINRTKYSNFIQPVFTK